MNAMTITTTDELNDFIETAEAEMYFATDSTDHAYVVFNSEDGEWYATRPADEDDQVDGRYPPGVTTTLDALPLPLDIQPTRADR